MVNDFLSGADSWDQGVSAGGRRGEAGYLATDEGALLLKAEKEILSELDGTGRVGGFPKNISPFWIKIQIYGKYTCDILILDPWSSRKYVVQLYVYPGSGHLNLCHHRICTIGIWLTQ